MATLNQVFADRCRRVPGPRLYDQRSADTHRLLEICGLTIREPWASLIEESDRWGGEGKRIECRSWSTSFRGVLLIHSSKWWVAEDVLATLAQLRARGLVGGRFPDVDVDRCRANTGHVIARAELVRCRELSDTDPDPWAAPSRRLVVGDKPSFAWELRNVERLNRIPAKGSLGLWEAGPDLRAQIEVRTASEPAHVAARATTTDPPMLFARSEPSSEPIADVNRVEHLRREAGKRDDQRSPCTIGEQSQAICKAIETRNWRAAAVLLEHAIGRLDLGEWQSGAWVVLPGTQDFRLVAPASITELIEYWSERVRENRLTWSKIPESSKRAITASIRQYDADADERARDLIERCGL